MLGIVHSVRRPSSVLAVQPGAVRKRLYDDRLIAYADVTIGNRIIKDAVLLFDTGATESVIFLPDATREIGEAPYDTGLVRMADGSLQNVLYYQCCIDFSGGVRITTDLIDVMEKSVSFADMIVGMDIISNGTLTVNGPEKTFSFEISK